MRSSSTCIRLAALAAAAALLTAVAPGCGRGDESEAPAPQPPAPEPSAPQASGPARVTVADSLTTVRLRQPTPVAAASGEASLIAARNEFESFQIVVGANRDLHDVNVASGEPLRGPGGALIPAGNISIYREVPYRVGTPAKPPSDSEGGAGLWPDALIPARDYFYGERRSAFPVDIPAQGKLVSWIDVLVPAEQRGGTYHGSVQVRDASGPVAEVPLTVRVLDFSIPSVPSLKSSFFGDPWQFCHAHTGSFECDLDDPSTWERRALYVRAGLENRISMPNGFPVPDSTTSRGLFARYAVPLIRGTDASLRLPGAKLTPLDASTFCVNAGGCLQTWMELARRYGFSQRFFAYLCDEPSADPSIWTTCAASARRSEQVWPGVPKLVTTSLQDAQENGGGMSGALRYIDLLAAPINRMIENGESQRPSYDSFLDPARNAPGTAPNQLWLYTSCLSYGCGSTPIGSSASVGWPGYAIDEPASAARAMGWLSFEYGATGELYWNTAASLSRAWSNQYLEGGNGDGNLFYPGFPDGGRGGVAIGGSHEIPIESIRLKRIRDAREDFEYLHILAERGGAAEAMKVVEGLFGPPDSAADNATVDPMALESARRQLAELIAAAPG